MSRGDNGNLIPFSERSEEEQREIRRKGGQARGRQRRKNKEMKELLKILLSEEVVNKKTQEKATRREVVLFSLLTRAQAGDIRAIELTAKLAGEMPVQPQQVDIGVTETKKPVIVFREMREDGDGE